MKEATAVNQLKAILRHMRARNMPESLEMTNAIADLQDELADLQQQLTEANRREEFGEWVELSSELPQVEPAKAFDWYGNIYETTRHIKTWLFDRDGKVFVGRVNHGIMTVCGFETENSEIVTHWMPFIEPPKPKPPTANEATATSKRGGE